MANKKEKKSNDYNTVTDRYATEFSQELWKDAPEKHLNGITGNMAKTVEKDIENDKKNKKKSKDKEH